MRNGEGDEGRTPSPPTARVVAVVEALAEGPRSLTDLARDLDLSAATLHAVLGTLQESAWVVRDPASRRFSLGPSVLDLVQRAARPASAAEVVERLAAELSLPVSLSRRYGDVLVVVHAAPGGGRPAPEVGRQLPYAVPFGQVLAAHDDAAAQEAWLTRSGDLQPEALAELRQHLAAVRERGCSVERFGPSALRLVQVLQDVRADPSSQVLAPLMQALLSEVLQTGLGPRSEGDPVTVLAAPVLDPAGRPCQSLNVHPFRRMSRRDVDATSARLRAAAAALDPPL